MEKTFDEKMDNIMLKPGVIGAICTDKRGLCLSDEEQTSAPASPSRFSADWDKDSTSSDEAEMTGSPKRSALYKRQPDEILQGSVKSASYNIVFQVGTRIFTFLLNAFILRYVSHEVLGVCNVRLALLYSSVIFLSREPFRRACLRKKDTDNWSETINLIWLSVPTTVFWSLVFGYVWCYALSNPGVNFTSEIAQQYRSSVWLIVLALILDSLVEVPYIVGQYFLFSKLRIVGDTTLILVRSVFLCTAVLFFPSSAVFAYALGTICAVCGTNLIYYGYFHYHIVSLGNRDLPFTGVKDFLPNYRQKKVKFPWELAILAWSFFKQGILKQILTEGERYLMTFFDILGFEEQGIYDVVANLGSLAARFIFLPVEESAYFYFAQTLERRESFSKKDGKLALLTSEVLGNLVKIMLIIGSVTIVYGIPYSGTLLYLYGGENLSGSGTSLLQANCAYIFIMALNGVTEAFTFAAMSKDQLDRFNQRLVVFSIVFLGASYVFTRAFGSIGFYLANSLNMGLRVCQSVFLIRAVFQTCAINPFEFWKLNRKVVLFYIGASLTINVLTVLFHFNRFVHVSLGVAVFMGNCATIYVYERDLIIFFVKLFKSKTV